MKVFERRESASKWPLILFLMTFYAWKAYGIGDRNGVWINSLQGDVFASINGRTSMVSKNQQLDDMVQIITGEGAQVTFSDYDNHKYHLAQTSEVKIMNNVIELRRGYLWILSFNASKTYEIHSANAVIRYREGEGIISYDNLKEKTQLFVISDDMEISNLIQQNYKIMVDSGQFSYVQKDRNGNYPRNATPVGFNSFKNVTSVFKNLIVGDEQGKYLLGELKGRTVASLPARSSDNSSRPRSIPGKIIFLKDKVKRGPSFNKRSFYDYSLKTAPKVPRKKVNIYAKKTDVQVQIFGNPKNFISQRKSRRGGRHPASTVSRYNKSNSEFEKSLNNQYSKQKRHSDEVNNLINELKTYSKDYNENY